MQVSIRSFFLLALYAGICSLVFLHGNIWIGTIVVGATIVLFSLTTLNAFQTQRAFPLAFSIGGWSWLVFCLGFYAQTGGDTKEWKLGKGIYLFLSRTEPETVDASYGEPPTFVTIQSLIVSGQMKSGPVPSYLNLIRLVVCVSSIGVGLMLAAIVTLLIRVFRPKTNPKSG